MWKATEIKAKLVSVGLETGAFYPLERTQEMGLEERDVQITYREKIPEKQAYFHLFETTGWNRAYQADADRLHQALSKSWYAVSAYDGDRLVGFGRVISDGILYAFICDMIVLPPYQRQGIGSAILRRLVERCRGAGVPVVWLFAAQGKAGFYQAHGFAPRPADAPGMQLVAAEEGSPP